MTLRGFLTKIIVKSVIPIKNIQGKFFKILLITCEQVGTRTISEGGIVFFSWLVSMKIETPLVPDTSTMTGQTILFLSLPKHDAHYTSTPWQIASQLASTNKVLFVDHPFTIIDLISGFYKPGILKRLKGYFGGSTYTRSGVDVILTPFVFPINFLPKGKFYDFLKGWNHKLLASRINRYTKKQKIESLIYVNSFDFYFPDLIKYLNAKVKLNTYHCIDPMVKAFTLKHGEYLQKQAAHGADLIITTAPALQHQFSGNGFPKSFLVPNAANFELFHNATNEIPLHPKVKGIEGKVMGYLGNIERRTDFNMLKKVLDILPDWQLLLVGPVERQYVPGEIFEHKRIHFIGPVPHGDAPSVVKRFDVSIIPFKCDQVSSGIYPLKLFEYMAAGKPVVSTNFNPEVLSELADEVYAADTDVQFADFVLLAYATDSKEKRDKRILVASQNTWEKRAQLFSKYLNQALDIKHSPYVA